jgi:diguanylate cyclase (GGDEF)-like protein
MEILTSLEKQSKSRLVFGGIILICIIGLIDYLTGYELAFSFFYVLPISLATLVLGQGYGYAASTMSAVLWLAADILSGQHYSSLFVPIWNISIRFAFFIIITYLLSMLNNTIRRERELSRIDHLTSAANSRYFYEVAQMEINRIRRYQHPFTLAFIDIDDFKSVNDKFGHKTGDLVLQKVVHSFMQNVRDTDVIARVGGDEFIILFPETGQEFAQTVFPVIHDTLLKDMQKNDLSITFSIGVVICVAAPPTIDDIVKIADDLMYSAKSDGKNTVKYTTYTG